MWSNLCSHKPYFLIPGHNEMPFELSNIPKTNADTITHLIKEFLIQMSLPIMALAIAGACKQRIGLDELPRDMTIPFHLKGCDEGRNVRW